MGSYFNRVVIEGLCKYVRDNLSQDLRKHKESDTQRSKMKSLEQRT